MVHIARTGTLALLGALLLLPSASALSIDLLGQGRVDVAEDETACIALHPGLLDILSLAAGACADLDEDGLDVDVAAATSVADNHLAAVAHADAGAQGAHAAAAAAGRAADIPIATGAAADVDDAPQVQAGAQAAGAEVEVSVPQESPGILERIGSWIRGLF